MHPTIRRHYFAIAVAASPSIADLIAVPPETLLQAARRRFGALRPPNFHLKLARRL